MMRYSLTAATIGWLGCALPAASPAPLGAPAQVGCGHLPPPDRMTATAVSTLCTDDLLGSPVVQVEEWLAGRVAGVQVLRAPRGGTFLRIRGPGSILGDNEPLYVLDGMPLYVAPGRGLYWLNPGDIQFVQILKDAGATAFYGMRGANGVVLITTRRGSRGPD